MKATGVPAYARSLAASGLSLALVLVSPGLLPYAAAGEAFRGRHAPSRVPSPSTIPALPAFSGAPPQSLSQTGITASGPLGGPASAAGSVAPERAVTTQIPLQRNLSGGPESLPLASGIAPQGGRSPGQQAGTPSPRPSVLEGLRRELPRFSQGSEAKHEAEQDFRSRIGPAAGAAYGEGDTHAVLKHERTNRIIEEAFKGGRASLLYGQAGAAGMAQASAEERTAFEANLQKLELGSQEAVVEGLGSFSLGEVLAAVKRVVLLDAAEGVPAAALRFDGLGDYQVSHVGFGQDHATPTLYLSRGFYKQAVATAIQAVLVNDLIELGARRLAQALSMPWSEELSRKVQDYARDFAESRYPETRSYVRALTRNLKVDLEALGLGPDLLRRDYLSDDPEEQQRLINRLAALRAKGFAASELSSALLDAQAALDAVLSSEGEVPEARVLKALRDSSPELFERLAQGLDLGRVLEGRPPLFRLPSSAHSQVQGLAWRVHEALSQGRDIRTLFASFPGDPRVMERIWKSWDRPQEASTLEALEQIPQIRTTLSSELRKVRASALTEKALLEKEARGLKNLIKKHPLVETWREMREQLRREASEVREDLRELPPVRGKSVEAEALRARKGQSREQIRRLGEQAEGLKQKVEHLEERAKPLAELSMAMREWFAGVKGLSVAGDYLWDPEGNGLDMLLIVAGDSSPRKLRPEVLRKVAGLSGLEVTGYVVGEKWLRETFLDVDRNVLASRFALLGLSLWGPNLANFFQKLPERELWAAAWGQLEAAQAQLDSPGSSKAGLTMSIALSLVTALGLKLHGGSLPQEVPGWMGLMEQEARLGPAASGAEPASPRASRRARHAARARAKRQPPPDKTGEGEERRRSLAGQLDGLRSALESLRGQGRRSDVERRLGSIFDKLFRRDIPGQVGGVLLGPATRGAASGRALYSLRARESSEWLEKLAQSGQAVPGAEQGLAEALERLKAKARYWEWLPEVLGMGSFVSVGATAFGRPVEVRVRISEVPEQPELMGLLLETEPEGAADRYEIFLNGALWRMEGHVQEAALGAILRQLGLAMEGMPLDAAREKAMAELQEARVRDDRKDREVLEEALADYRGGVRVEASKGLGRGARPDEVLRLAQAVSDYLNAPQRRLGGTILLGLAEESLRPLVERMAEVFAGNGLEAVIAEGESLPGALNHAVREGSYRMGFLVSNGSVLPFGHYKGGLPEDELTEVRAAENAVRRVRRLDLSSARLHGLVHERRDVQRSYLASLQERFETQRIAASGPRLLIDTDQSETGALLRALGLGADIRRLNGNAEALRELIVKGGAGRRLGVLLGSDGSGVKFLDSDGSAVNPSDLSLIFTWYLVKHRGHRGKIFRAFTQTRLLDRLAERFGLTVEEVDPSVWGVADADSIILSPWTPYNDPISQALLAAEIMATTGQSLGALLQRVRRELGSPLEYRKLVVSAPPESSERLADTLSESEIRAFLAKALGLPEDGVHARRSLKGIQLSLDGGWLYLRAIPEGFELYAEHAEAGRAERMLRAGEDYLRGRMRELGPSKFLRVSLILATIGAILVVGLVLLPLLDPTLVLSTPILGQISQMVGRLVELGFNILQWFAPNIFRPLFPTWNNPLFMSVSVLLFLEAVWYWGISRLIIYTAFKRRHVPGKGPLAPEIQRLPDLPRQSRPETNDYFTVAPLKDGRLAVLKPAFRRIWEWLQPLLFVYQAQTLIQSKRYDDSNVLFRQAINARGWLFFKALILEPYILFLTWWNLFSASFPGLARVAMDFLRLGHKAWRSLWGLGADWKPVPGLPTHISPEIGVPLPARLRGRYRTEVAFVSKVSDGDTVQLFDPAFARSRWVRYKGMDASDNKRGDLYRRAKERNAHMVRGKKVVLLVPQAGQGEQREDEYDDKGRLLAYVYAQDPSGQWVNMSRLLYLENLATTLKGAPDPEVPYSLDVLESRAPPKSLLGAQGSEAAPPPEAGPVDSPEVLDAELARAALAAAQAQLAGDAQVRLEASFAGAQGQELGARLGQGATLGPRSQLFVSGSGVSIGSGLELAEGSRLNLDTPSAPEGAEMGRILVGNGVVVEARLRVIAGPESQLRILNGTRLTGDREIVVPPGRWMSLRNLPDGSLDLQAETPAPSVVWRRLWEAFKRGTGLETLLDWVRANRLSPAELQAWWRRAPRLSYRGVDMPRKLSELKLVSRERAPRLEGRHPDLVAAAVEAKQRQMLRSSREVPQRYLLRREGSRAKLKQGLLLGLERYYQVLAERQQAKIRDMVAAIEAKVSRWLSERAELNERERARFLRVLKQGSEAEAILDEDVKADDDPAQSAKKRVQSWAKIADKLPQRTQDELSAVREEVEALNRILEKQGQELGFYLQRAQERLASLAGLILQGPSRLPSAQSVVLGGSYLFDREPGALELLVVRGGEEGPRVMDSSLLQGVALPAVERLSVVSVGEGWLKGHGKDGMRNRLLTRFLVTGTTLWGRDLAALRLENLGKKIPASNMLALARELLEETPEGPARLESAYLAHLILLAAVPGLVERIEEPSAVPAPSLKGLAQQVRRQLQKASDWLDGEELHGLVGRGVAEAAAHGYADSGLGGVLVGDVRPEQFGRKALYKLSSQEAWAWIQELARSSPALDDAQARLAGLLEKLKSRGHWWSWYPEWLEEGHFVVVGRDSRGRLVEVRVRVAHAGQTPGVLALLAQSEEGRGISDVDRYELFLNGALFEMDAGAQELVLGAAIRQLELALAGHSLRSARDIASRELGLSERGGKTGAKLLETALEDYARGIRVREVRQALDLPWENSAWRGELDAESAARLGKGLGDFLSSAAPSARSRVVLGYAEADQEVAAKFMAGVLTARGVSVALLEAPAAFAAVAAALAGQGPSLGVWISAQETKVMGQDGKPLSLVNANAIGWLALRAQSVRSLPLALAREQGLLEASSSPAPAAPGVQGASQEGRQEGSAAPAAARGRLSMGLAAAFLFHTAIVGLVLAILIGPLVFPAFFASLPLLQTLFALVRSMMMFKSVLLFVSAVVAGFLLAAIPSAIRYWRYGKLMYRMVRGEGRYRGLAPELEGLPRIHSMAKRSEIWLPADDLRDGRIAIREEGFARLPRFWQILIYIYAAARVRFSEHFIMGYFYNMANKTVLGRFKIARVTFFVLTQPFVLLLEWVMLWNLFWNRLLGRPYAPLYRVAPESDQGLPILPSAVRQDFTPERVKVTAVINDSTVQLEDGRVIRVIGSGAPGKAVTLTPADPRAAAEVSRLLVDQEVFLVTANDQPEDTRRLPGHLYLMDPDIDGAAGAAAKRPRMAARAVHALAARYRSYGYRLPPATAVDSDRLPLFLSLEEASAEQVPASRAPSRGERVFAGLILVALAGLGVWAFVGLSGAALAPLAHKLAILALILFLLPAVYGLLRLLRGSKRGFVLKHKFLSTATAVTLAALLAGLFHGPDWAKGPMARGLANGSTWVLENTSSLPRPPYLGYENGGPRSPEGSWRLRLAAEHPLIRQSRALFTEHPYTADALELRLPAELAAKYRAVWGYVVEVEDGDTVVLSNGERVRYLGINTPETEHVGMDAKEPAQPGGIEAHHRNAELTDRRKILMLVPHERNRDAYRRVLAYVYAQDGSGQYSNVNVILLKEGHGNDRYGGPDPLVSGPHRILDVKSLAVGAQPRSPAAKRLVLNPNETRTYIQEPVRFARWIDSLTLELEGGRRAHLRSLDIPEAKRAEALEYVQARLKAGDEFFLLHVKAYDGPPGELYQKDDQGRTRDYAYVRADDGGYENLNALIFSQGLSTTENGKPDPALPPRALLERDLVDHERVAWEAAQAPLRAMTVKDPALLSAYAERVHRLGATSDDAAEASQFQAGVSLLGLYAGQGMIPASEQEELLAALLKARGAADYDSWVLERLAPVLRRALAAQKIPTPPGRISWEQAAWAEVILWSAAGKLGTPGDSLYFEAAEQAGAMREFLAGQDLRPQESALRYAEGVFYAKLQLRIPPALRPLLPQRTIAGSAGAFWAAAELAQIHRHLLGETTRVSPLLMAMSYSYPESSALMFSDSRRYAALTLALAKEALTTPQLLETNFRHMEGFVSPVRLAKMRRLLDQGQNNAAVKELSPSELFMLGRLLSDEPQLNKYMLKSHKALRVAAGRVMVQGTAWADFQRELDALLELPGGVSLGSSSLERYESLEEDEWRMQRRLFADILIQTVAAMQEQNVPARLLPLLLPKAAETIQRAGTRASSANDWDRLSDLARRITPGQIRSWVHELSAEGLMPGEEPSFGLLKRDLEALRGVDFSAGVESFDHGKVVGDLGFPPFFETGLRTFKHGSFRVAVEEHSPYAAWKAGDLIKIMVGKKASRRALFLTKIASIEQKKLKDLTLDELRSEFPPNRFWDPLKDEEELRRELIAELLGGLKRFYPEVSEESEGFMIVFRSYPEVRQNNR